MKNILTVLRFEYKGFVSTKSFRVVTIIFVAAIIIVASLPQIIGGLQSLGVGDDSDTSGDKAALILTGEALTSAAYQGAFTPEALKDAGSVTWVDLSANPPDEESLSGFIRDGEYLFALRYSGGAAYEIFAAGNRMSSYAAITPVGEYITEVAKEAEIQTLPAETQESARRISTLKAEPTVIDIGGNAQNNFWIGYVLIMFLFYVIMGYSNYVSASIITEKTSKAMELLVTSVRPIHLMVGKVIGVGLASLTQVGIIVASFAAGILINLPYWRTSGSFILDIIGGGNVDAWIAVIVIVYFLLGFFLYAFLMAAFASTVTKPEEAATVTTLPMVLIMAALGLGFMTLSGAVNKGLVAAISYVPFFTPINMVARYTIGDAGMPQLLLGIAILIAAIIVVAILSAKIFRMGTMLYGMKITPRELVKALKNA